MSQPPVPPGPPPAPASPLPSAAAEAAPLRVLIVDDEPLARLRLRGLVEANPLPRASVVGEAGDALAARQLLAEGLACDLVLLDIVMPGGSGLKLADSLRQAAGGGVPPMVVFVTAHAGHALEAFEVDATDYITKPVRRERLQAALQRVAQRRPATPVAEAGPALVVRDRGRVLRIPLAELVYLKAEQKYVTLQSTRGQWLLDEPLAELARQLGDGLLRVHRNALVALWAVRALERTGAPAEADAPEAEAAAAAGADGAADAHWQVRLANGEALAVSRRQLGAVREVLARAAGGS